MTILRIDRLPQISPKLAEELREKSPDLYQHLQALHVALREWRKEWFDEIGGGTGELTVKDEGVAVGTAGGITTIDFVGGNVTASGSGADATVTITTGLTVKDEGVTVGTAGGITSIDFTGSGVSVSATGGAATASITGGGSPGFDWGKYIAGRFGFRYG